MSAALPLLFFVWAFAGGGKGSPPWSAPRAPGRRGPRARRMPRSRPTVIRPSSSAPSSAPAASTPAPQTPPWPQVVPKGLPAFPGPAWEPDEPPPTTVQTRAGQLLAQLWKGGAGTFKVEQTDKRWIAYRATQMGTKRGVVAYRLKPAKQRPKPAPAPSASSKPPPVRVVPTSHTTRLPGGSITQASPVELPTLRYGMGLKPKPPNDDVKLAQGILRITADGRFGSGTRTAVKAFQRRKRLTPDGVIGSKTWTALLASGARS